MAELENMTLTHPMPTDPPDASTWERGAVIYVLVLLSILIAIHIPLEIRGRMKWEKIRMEHVAESARSCCPTWCLCAWRCFCSLMVLYVDFVIVSTTNASSKLAGGGWMVFATFTIWSWTLIGVYMALAAFTSFVSVRWGWATAKSCVWMILCRFLWLLFEVMLPVSFLIFLAVWLVLLPAAYHTTGTDMGLLSPAALASHNLNFLFMFVEALVNRLCITTFHLTFIFYYGALYVIFSWIFFSFYHFFFYFFIDWRYSLVLMGYTALLVNLTIFFFLGRCMVNCVKPPLYTWDLEESDSEGSENDSVSCSDSETEPEKRSGSP